MDGTRAVKAEHFKVEFGAVAFVAIKAVLRIFFVESEYESVSRDFGNNRSCHAFQNGSICFYNGFLRYGKIKKKVSIND